MRNSSDKRYDVCSSGMPRTRALEPLAPQHVLAHLDAPAQNLLGALVVAVVETLFGVLHEHAVQRVQDPMLLELPARTVPVLPHEQRLLLQRRALVHLEQIQHLAELEQVLLHVGHRLLAPLETLGQINALVGFERHDLLK